MSYDEEELGEEQGFKINEDLDDELLEPLEGMEGLSFEEEEDPDKDH